MQYLYAIPTAAYRVITLVGNCWALIAEGRGVAVSPSFVPPITSLGPDAQVRKTPRWPRSWAKCSPLQLRIPTGMHGLTWIFWANLTPVSLQPWRLVAGPRDQGGAASRGPWRHSDAVASARIPHYGKHSCVPSMHRIVPQARPCVT